MTVVSTEHQSQDAESFVGVRVSVERGQRGSVGWKLSIVVPADDEELLFHDAFETAISALKRADDRMKIEFGEAAT